MKKYLLSIIVLCIAGAFISGLMTIEHFYPEMQGKVIACGDALSDPCFAVNQSDYSTFLTIPLAAWGIYLYLLFIFVLLIADYAQYAYYHYAVAVMLPLTVLALLFDIVLASILLYLKQFCTLCIATYCVNLAILLLLMLWKRKLPPLKYTYMSFIRYIQSRGGTPHQRAAFSLTIISAVLLLFAVFSTSHVLKAKTYSYAPPQEEITAFVNDYKNMPRERMVLPNTALQVGPKNAPVTIVVFTDFLCRACYKLYLVERNIFARFGGSIRVVYVNFPLDASCNRHVRETLYQNSCIASRALIASARLGLFHEYLTMHFGDYTNYANSYERRSAFEIMNGLIGNDKFNSAMNSERTGRTLEQDIELAIRYKIKATPTLFINGRRIEGVPPKEFLFSVIEQELKRK